MKIEVCGINGGADIRLNPKKMYDTNAEKRDPIMLAETLIWHLPKEMLVTMLLYLGTKFDAKDQENKLTEILKSGQVAAILVHPDGSKKIFTEDELFDLVSDKINEEEKFFSESEDDVENDDEDYGIPEEG